MKRKLLGSLLFLAAFSICDSAFAATFTVNNTDDHDDGVCDSGDSGDCTLREAILAAKRAGGFNTIKITATGEIKLSSPLPPLEASPRSLPRLDLVINGPGAKVLTVQRDEMKGVFGIFDIVETAAIKGLTITKGGNGAIFNGGHLRLQDCVITGNTARNGGGAIWNFGRLEVINCTISNNIIRGDTDLSLSDGSAEGGAIHNGGVGSVRVVNSTLSGNAAFGAPPPQGRRSSHASGGAIMNRSGTVTLINSTISGNVARGGDTGVFLSALESATATEQDAKKYYDIVDPNGKRKTLGDWWYINGFDRENGGNPVGALNPSRHVAYFNNNDLGFGRDTTMKAIAPTYYRPVGSVASWLANYSLTPPYPDQNPLSADAALAREPSRAVATVCMEYSQIEDIDGGHSGKPIVKFFVFNGVGPKAERVLSADLDGYGQKFVPYLCTTCHGGRLGTNPTKSDVLKMNSFFREFDIASFKFARPGFPIDHPERSSPDGREQREFFAMNNLVLATNPSPAIQELIKGWYRSSPNGDFQDPNFVPPGWQHHPTNHQLDGEVKQLYQQVIATSCRTCHIAGNSNPKDSTFNPLLPDFRTFAPVKDRPNASFTERASQVLVDVFQYHNAPPFAIGNVTMPHAMITFKNFWKSENPHRPTVLADELARLTDVFKNFSDFNGKGADGTAAQGGAIDNDNGTVTIAASTVAFNTASGGIGFSAIQNGDHLDVTSSIGMGDAGGVFSDISLEPTQSSTLHSSIVAENFGDTDNFADIIALRADNLGGSFVSRDFNLIGQSADFTLRGETTHNLLNGNPRLGLLADNGGPTFTHALETFSPALDAGDNHILDLVSTDQRGFSRKVGYYISTPPGAVDIGAFEAGGTERDVTPQMRITRGGFYFNRNTQHYVQQVTVRNVGTTAVNGRLRLALDALSNNVALSNEDGTDSQFGGIPFVSFADNGMSLGGSISITLEFTNPLNTAVTYRPRVLEVVPVP